MRATALPFIGAAMAAMSGLRMERITTAHRVATRGCGLTRAPLGKKKRANRARNKAARAARRLSRK